MTVRVVFTRDSVSAGDDMNPMHEEQLDAAASLTLGELLAETAGRRYVFPMPKAVWVPRWAGTHTPEEGPVAEIGEPWPAVRFPRETDRDLTLADLASAGQDSPSLALHFQYDTSQWHATTAGLEQAWSPGPGTLGCAHP